MKQNKVDIYFRLALPALQRLNFIHNHRVSRLFFFVFVLGKEIFYKSSNLKASALKGRIILLIENHFQLFFPPLYLILTSERSRTVKVTPLNLNFFG